MKLWKNDDPVVQFHLFEKEKDVMIKKGSSFLTPWDLADIAYYAIVNTNELNPEIISEHQFMNLYGLFLSYNEKISNIERESKKLDGESMFFYILFGLSQKTFWYQEKYRMINKFVRFSMLLRDDYTDDKNIQSIIEEDFNTDFNTFSRACFILTIFADKDFQIRIPLAVDDKLSSIGITDRLLENILKQFSTEYKVIRDSTLMQKQLFLTPIIKDSKNNYTILNSFIFVNKCLSFIYWYTRDKYREKYNKELNQVIGGRFERYVDSLLDRMNIRYEKIKAIKKQSRADLKIYTKNFIILVEQKYQMFNISQKDIIFDISKIDNGFKEYLKAVKQLSLTEEVYKDEGSIIKLILYFDDMYVADGLIKERLEKISHDNDLKFQNVFMINIEEFEILLQILKKDENLFMKIIEEKIDRQYLKGHSKGVEFKQIMQEFKLFENKYIEEELDKILFENISI